MTLKENYKKIRDLENLIINLAENGKRDLSLELKMQSLTYNYLRLTHRNLKMNPYDTPLFNDKENNEDLLYCWYTEKHYPSSEVLKDNFYYSELRYIHRDYVEKYLDYLQKEIKYTDEEKYEHYLEFKNQ